MAFFEEPRMNPLITNGCRSKKRWSRIKTYTGSGKLTQDFRWPDYKSELNLAYRGRPIEEYQELEDYFHVVMANAHEAFRVKVWDNYLLTQTNSAVTFINGTDWQIQRKHGVGGAYYLKDVKKPVVEAVTIWTPSLADAGATIDWTTGIASIPGSSDGDVFTATGEFDTPMTFTNDEWIGNYQGNSDDLWISTEPIMLEEFLL